jgi:hypothetical protein
MAIDECRHRSNLQVGRLVQMSKLSAASRQPPAHPKSSWNPGMLKSLIRARAIGAIRWAGYELVRVRPAIDRSQFGESELIDLLAEHTSAKTTAVDIGALDGYNGSNTLRLFSRGWNGLAVDCDPEVFGKLSVRYAHFPGVALAKLKVTPANVVKLLDLYNIPKDFGVLSLDIDSYDYFVLDRLLAAYHPHIICAEINEKIPPPIRFALRFADHYPYERTDCYGMSISMVELLARQHQYEIVWLEYNNVLLVAKEVSEGLKAMDAAEAYDRGYRDRPDRLRRLPWNVDMECLQTMTLADEMDFIRDRFRGYEGLYVLEA